MDQSIGTSMHSPLPLLQPITSSKRAMDAGNLWDFKCCLHQKVMSEVIILTLHVKRRMKAPLGQVGPKNMVSWVELNLLLIFNTMLLSRQLQNKGSYGANHHGPWSSDSNMRGFLLQLLVLISWCGVLVLTAAWVTGQRLGKVAGFCCCFYSCILLHFFFFANRLR